MARVVRSEQEAQQGIALAAEQVGVASQQAVCACVSRARCGGAESEMQTASCATTYNTLQTSLRLRLIRLRMQQRNKRPCSARQGAPAMRDATQLAR